MGQMLPGAETARRFFQLDVMRSLAALLMINSYVLIYYGDPVAISSTYGFFISFLGGPAVAPVFTLLMGVFIVYPRSVGLRQGCLRGLQLFVIGYALSYLRYYLPMSLGWVDSLPIRSGSLWWDFIWEVDLLQFAGLAMVLLTLLVHFFPQWRLWMVLAGGVVLIAPYLWGVHGDGLLLSWLSNLLWGTAAGFVWYPLFPWLAFPLCGMCFGKFLRRSRDLVTTAQRFALPGFILLAIAILVVVLDLEAQIGDFYRSGPGAVIWMISLIFLWICLMTLLPAGLQSNLAGRFCGFWSRNITIIYCIQWVLIGWAALWVPYQRLGLAEVVGMVVLVIVTTHMLTVAFLWARRRVSKSREMAGINNGNCRIKIDGKGNSD